MDDKEERLVARLRHQDPSLTVTEIHFGNICNEKKKKVIEFLRLLELRPNVESSAGLETVISIDISSAMKQRDILNKLMDYFKDIGVGDVSITSEPFDERLPEIEVSDASIVSNSVSRGYSQPLKEQDLVELISHDKSESEFELILSHPGQNSKNRRLHQSSRDIIGSLLRVNDRSQDTTRSGCSEASEDQSESQHRDLHQPKPNKVSTKPKDSKQTFWARAKSIFKKKRREPESVYTMQYYPVQVTNDNENKKHNEQKDGSEDKFGRRSKIRHGSHRNDKSAKNIVSLDTLQMQLEKVSQDLFNLQSKCSNAKKKNTPSLGLDAWTQTFKGSNSKLSEDSKENSSTASESESTVKNSKSYKNEASTSSGDGTTTKTSSSTTTDVPIGKGTLPPPLPKGMIRNVIRIYPKQAPNMRQPVMYSFNALRSYNKGGQIFFRRVMRPKVSSDTTRTTTSSLCSSTTTVSKSMPTSTETITGEKEEEQDIVSKNSSKKGSKLNIISTIIDNSYIKPSKSGIKGKELHDKGMLTQSDTPNQAVAVTNTSQIFTLSKITQTKIPDERAKSASVISSFTSCSELPYLESSTVGTEMGRDWQKLRLKSDQEVQVSLKCETCNNRQSFGKKQRRRNSHRKFPNLDDLHKRGLAMGILPDGNFGIGQEYAPGRVVPSWGPDYSINPYAPPYSHPPANTGSQCPKLCSFFNKKRSLKEELRRQNVELMQMKLILSAINAEIKEEESIHPPDDKCHPALKNHPKKVTFKEPLVQ